MLDRTVRALFRALKIAEATPPFDTPALKVYYPAAPTSSDAERNTGNIPPDAPRAPFPVVIFFSAVNVGLEGYRWLGRIQRNSLMKALINRYADDADFSLF